MKNILLIVICIYLQQSLFGQTGSTKLDHWIKETNSDFVIVDFFASGCIACFKSLPKINQLQQQYKGKVKFLLVGKEDGKIQNTYEMFREKFNLDLDVRYDSTIQKAVGITGYPKYMWIQNGELLGASYSDALTEDRINEFIHSELDREKLIKNYARFNVYKQWNDLDNNAGAGVLLFRSALMKSTDSTPYYIPTSVYKQPVPGTFHAMNVTGEDLYRFAFFGRNNWMAPDSMYGVVSHDAILEINDTIKLRKDRYCYTVTVPGAAQTPALIQDRMKKDLEDYFGYDVSVELLDMPCLKLIIHDDTKIKSQSKLSSKRNWFTHAGMGLYNVPVQKLIAALSTSLTDNRPIIDHTGIDFNIDIELSAIMYDLEDVRTSLQKKGFDLVPSFAPMQVLVIREKRMLARKATAFSRSSNE